MNYYKSCNFYTYGVVQKLHQCGKTIKQDLDLPIEHQHNPTAIILLLQINSK